jgi:hypothetical protein
VTLYNPEACHKLQEQAMTAFFQAVTQRDQMSIRPGDSIALAKDDGLCPCGSLGEP